MKRCLTTLYAKHCGRTYEEVEKALDRDRFMNSEQGVEWGLVDKILTTRTDDEKQAA